MLDLSKKRKRRSHLEDYISGFVTDIAGQFHYIETYNCTDDIVTTDSQIASVATVEKSPPDDHQDAQPITKSVTQAPTQPITKSVTQAPTQPITKSVTQAPTQSATNSCSVPRLTWKQDSILRILYNKYNESTRTACLPFINRVELSSLSGLSYGSVHECLKILKRKLFYRTVSIHHDANYTGFVIGMNENLCRDYFSIYTNSPTQPITKTYNQSLTNPPTQPILPISSSFNIIKLTTKDNLMKLPEMGFWQVEPNVVTEKLFQSWIEEFNLTKDLLITYLDRCRFEMTELKKEEKLNKGSAVNWFYGVMRKRGGSYPEPQGYKSIQELKLEEEKNISEKNEAITAELYEVRLKQEFNDIIGDHGSDKYRLCLNELTKYERALDKNGMAFRKVMWHKFKSLRDSGEI